MAKHGTLYVIQDNATKRWLPDHRVAKTHAEFGDNGPPRLFTTNAGAVNAMKCWQLGLWRLTGDEDGYYPEPATWKGNAEVAERRQAMDLSVVPVRLLPVRQ